MREISDLFSKAADALVNKFTEGVKSEPYVITYTYNDFKELINVKKNDYSQISKCTISIELKKEFDDLVFSNEKYIIRIVMLDDNRCPILVNNSNDEYVGSLVIADSIDIKLKKFMGEKKEKVILIGGK